MGHLFITENILGFQSLDLGLQFSLVCHPFLSLQPNLLLKFPESKETLVKTKQIKIQDLGHEVLAQGEITSSLPSVI